MAAKDNVTASDIDKTSFWWTGLCAVCHPGGGPSEFDRDGQLYYDTRSAEFGYEKLGKTAADVTLDGDYCEVSNKTGALRKAPWDVTGVAEPDCLMCHRADRTLSDGKNMNWIWRTATLRAKDALVDGGGASVPAYAAAATAGQGWFSGFGLAETPAGKPPMANLLTIDYQAGLTDGSLVQDAGGILRLSPDRIASDPPDFACWGCHATADLKKRGRTWFDPAEDVHYAWFNGLDDEDAANDRAPGESKACTQCHPAGMGHDLAKGASFLGSVRNDRDFEGFRTCAGCHLPGDGRHPSAPEPVSAIHTDDHLAKLSCEFCHIPYKTTEASFAVDNATTGSTINYQSSAFVSVDPVDPSNPDRSRWHPSFRWRDDPDGERRLYPVKLLMSAWWGDWDRNGTPGDTTDDRVRPIALWRVRQATGGAPLAGTTDDNGDGKVEVNRPAEILAYLAALRAGTDSHGTPFAAEPVLVKGGRIWFDAGGGAVESLDYHQAGIDAESTHPFSVNHNVRRTGDALGKAGCSDCHFGSPTSPNPVFDRLVPVSPFDDSEDARPVYKTVRQLTGMDPF